MRAAIARVDKEQLVSVRDVMTLEDIAWEATGRHRFRAVLVMTFAALALVLAMVGVFGILAYSVQQRVRDFGVRRALGATTSDVLRLVVASAARVVGDGRRRSGLVLAAAGGRLIETMLFGVRPLDPTTFAFVTVVLALTAALSIAGPAWRAARIDPGGRAAELVSAGRARFRPPPVIQPDVHGRVYRLHPLLADRLGELPVDAQALAAVAAGRHPGDGEARSDNRIFGQPVRPESPASCAYMTGEAMPQTIEHARDAGPR